jgi:hypothetical protein
MVARKNPEVLVVRAVPETHHIQKEAKAVKADVAVMR